MLIALPARVTDADAAGLSCAQAAPAPARTNKTEPQRAQRPERYLRVLCSLCGSNIVVEGATLVVLGRVFLQPCDRQRPRLLRRFHVGAVVAGLRAEEPVRGALENVRLVHFAELLHL